MYQTVQNKLKEAGELMIQMSDGKEFELHLHNVNFDDNDNTITIEAADKTFWLDGNEIIYCWIHRDY